MKNRNRGFSAAFLTMIFGVMIMLTFAFIRLSSEKAVVSSCDAVFSLAGQSVLSEFDLELKENYGLMAYGLNQSQVAGRLTYYANANLQSKRELNMIPMKLERVEVNNKEYSMIDADELEESILSCMKFKMAENVIIRRTRQESSTRRDEAGRTLLNEKMIEALPSSGIKGSGFFADIILNGGNLSLKEAFQAGTIRFVVDSYITTFFKCGGNSRKITRETFFENEQEYILYGKTGDRENRKKFLDDFIKLRTGLNLSHIYTDRLKVKQIALLANLLTPGPASVGTQALIAGVWSYSEALNDAKLLEAGEKVPIIKAAANWALCIDSYERSEGGCIQPPVMSGYTYEDYLRMFLYLEDRETKLLRIMDLIQINLAGTYDENFLLGGYYTGYSCELVVNGKNFSYEEEY